MKSFTMIPDKLMTLTLPGCKGSKPVVRRIIVAYLIRAYGFPKLERWDDLTIQQISKWARLTRWNASKHFNYIVDNWVDEFLPIVEWVEDYRGLDFPGFYRFLQDTQRRAKSNVPKPRTCANSAQVRVLFQHTTRTSERLRRLSTTR
jgi:hypothetical protein